MSKPDKNNIVHAEVDLVDKDGKKLSDTEKPKSRVMSKEHIEKENARFEAMYGKFDPNSEKWQEIMRRSAKKVDSGKGLIVTRADGTKYTI